MTSLVAMVGLGLAYLAYMRRYVLHDIPLTAALSGRLQDVQSGAGQLGYYTVQNVRHYGPLPAPGAVPPLLFIHDVGVAASSYDVRPLYEHYAHERTVYALDLPGFGFSERGNRPYTPALYRDAIHSFLSGVLRGTPVDAVALGLGAEFLALAAQQHPGQFHSLTFITPTGMGRMGRDDVKRRPNPALLRLMLYPAWSRVLYDTLTSRIGLRCTLGSLQRRRPDRGLLHYAYVTSHQPGAEYAPFHYLSGGLFTPDVFTVYRSLAHPVLLLYGRGPRAHFDRVDELRTRPNWRIAEFRQCGDLVHFDDPRAVIARLDQHLKGEHPKDG